MTSYVLGLCFNKLLDKVILIRKTRPEWQRGRLNGVGGHVEPGETPAAAMEREFREEAGWQGRCDWIPFGRLSGDGWEVHLFRGTYTAVPGPFNETEEGLVKGHHVAHVLSGTSQESPVLPNLLWLIPMAINHATKADKAEYFDVAEKSFEEGRATGTVWPQTVPTPACTGVSASWCPIHGDCSCDRESGEMDDEDCPLHKSTSTHATAAASDTVERPAELVGLELQVRALREALELVCPGLACMRIYGDGTRDCSEELARPGWELEARGPNPNAIPCAICRARQILATGGVDLAKEGRLKCQTKTVK